MSNNADESWTETGGPYFPTTSEIGFLEAARDDAVAAFVGWRASLDEGPVQHTVGGGLDEGIESLLPLTTVDRRRWVFFEAGAWTAFFDNGARGTDAAPVASYLAQALGSRGLRVVNIPDGRDTYGATILELYGPTNTDFLNYIRSISAANDGGRWRFDAKGTPQPFEDELVYSRRRIKDRFTPGLLAHYLGSLGVSAFDATRYGQPVLVRRTDPEPERVENLTLEQARARYTAPQ